jgi:hypothetical protein
LIIFLISSSFKGLKYIISSRRLRNSGGNLLFNCLSNIFLELALSSSLKPIPFPKSLAALAPIFDVNKTITFLKSTFCPELSVKNHSSRTCRKIL